MTKTTLLQDMILPEKGICTERDLYFRIHSSAGFEDEKRIIEFAPGGHVSFDTYFNLFPLGKWYKQCDLRNLAMELRGSGRFEVSIYCALFNRSWERVLSTLVTLEDDEKTEIDVPAFDVCDDRSVVYLEVRALSNGKISGAQWRTKQAPLQTPELMLSVTTFKREVEMENTVRRFKEFLKYSEFQKNIRMLIVDNGHSFETEDTDRITCIKNSNLGGAGGFTRGLLEARKNGHSHCLFVDDDATMHMASIDRTYAMLAYATDPDLAICGAMINDTHRWALWENGATYDQRCVPLHMGLDLRDAGQVISMEFETSGPQPKNLYGGWWYFAFPVDRVKHLPFPYFVRGDDVSFSLANDFNIQRLPGVASFQGSFIGKQSPTTWYLDLRSHLAHHLNLPELDVGVWKTLRIAVWFLSRNLARHHYESMSAINYALEDVMEGPDYFTQNAGMIDRRATLKELNVLEKWRPIDSPLPEEKRTLNTNNPITKFLLTISHNGVLLPMFRTLGNRVVVNANEREKADASFGAVQITYRDETEKNMYTVSLSRRAALRQTLRFIRNSIRFVRNYNKLKAQWQAGYDEITGNENYWKSALLTENNDKTARPS